MEGNQKWIPSPGNQIKAVWCYLTTPNQQTTLYGTRLHMNLQITLTSLYNIAGFYY